MTNKPKQPDIPPILWIVCALFFFAVIVAAVAETPDITPLIADAPASVSDTTQTTQTQGKVNLNTATVEDLMTLPNIGEVLAGRIVQYREEQGAFDTVEDLLNVPGIGEKTLEGIRDRITV